MPSKCKFVLSAELVSRLLSRSMMDCILEPSLEGGITKTFMFTNSLEVIPLSVNLHVRSGVGCLERCLAFKGRNALHWGQWITYLKQYDFSRNEKGGQENE